MLLLSTQVVEWLVCQRKCKEHVLAHVLKDHIRCMGYLNFVTIFVMLRTNPIHDPFTRIFAGVKETFEGFPPIVGTSLKVKPTKGSNSPKVRRMYNGTQGICQLQISWGAIIKYDWEGGGRNLIFSAKYFVPHEEKKILYFHAPVNIFDFASYPSFCQRSLCYDNFMYMYNSMMNCTLFCQISLQI